MRQRIQIICVLALLSAFLFTLNIAPVSAQAGGIGAIAWNGEYWLMATMEGDLVKYNGQEFSYLANLGCAPLEIKWAGDYWLMGCREVALDYAPQKIACNEEYCLMFGSEWACMSCYPFPSTTFISAGVRL